MTQDTPKIARVIEILGRKGFRGATTQATVQLTEDNGTHRTLTRNFIGPLRLGDSVWLMESEREVRRM